MKIEFLVWLIIICGKTISVYNIYKKLTLKIEKLSGSNLPQIHIRINLLIAITEKTTFD